MSGTLVNNTQLRNLISAGELEITEWAESNLSLVHYTLHVSKVKRRSSDGEWKIAHDFSGSTQNCPVKANEYLVVEAHERIKLLSDYIVGEFCPTSTLIEDGFGLTAGKIDKKYGKESEVVVFGLKNLVNEENEIRPFMRVAHVAFFDLRGSSASPAKLSRSEKETRRRLRKAYDDGVFYEGN